ncbi:MAG: patatin-like phospholipase family protein [Gemmatimonadaceae bacterium]|nr:patatin-like phospholipase family protein [Gemmatimonadaceae bacterium]
MTALRHRRVGAAPLVALFGLLVLARPADSQSCAPLRTGLVLSGGGARGFAHVGVFKILDSLHIRPDFIVGSSIGAIAGALYASGYSGNEIDSITRALPLQRVIRTYSPTAPRIMEFPAPLAVWESDGRGLMLQTGSVREAEVNALMSAMMLRGNLLARGDFDRLPIPLRVVSTRLSTRETVVLRGGDLAQALRASFAIPLIFAPSVIGDDVLVDGGVSDNIPVAAARAMGAQRLIISTLPNAVAADNLQGDPIKVALQLADFLFRNDTTTFRPQDVIIRNRTSEFGSLDFSQATLDSLVRGGMHVAREAFAKSDCIRTVRDASPAPDVRASAVPRVMTELRINTTRRMEAQTLRLALGLSPARPFREDSLRVRLLRLGESDDYRALWLEPSGRDSSVSFSIAPVYSAKQVVAVGLAYDNDLGGRMWGGIAWRDLLNAAVEASSAVDFGKFRQEWRAGMRRQIPAFANVVPLIANVRAVSEDILLYSDNSERDVIGTRELSIAMGVSRRLRGGFRVDVAPTARWWRVAQETAVNAVGLHVLLADGAHAADTRTIVEGEANTRFLRLHAESNMVWRLGAFRIVPKARVSWSRRAPLQEQFFLGGYDGFGGLRTTELRAEQEAMVGLSLARIIVGPIRALGEISAGSMGSGAGFLRPHAGTAYGQLIRGGRIGGEVRAGAFNVLIQRGFNSEGGDLWFVRIGQWF